MVELIAERLSAPQTLYPLWTNAYQVSVKSSHSVRHETSSPWLLEPDNANLWMSDTQG